MLKNGWLLEAKKLPSPNKNQRPLNTKIDLLVIHNISLPPAEFNNTYIEDFFLNKLDICKHECFVGIKDLKVSAHVLIKRDGETIQFVSFLERAWHAGVSSFKGRTACNDFSIGVELQGTDDLPYTDLQYKALNNLIEILQQNYPINNIVGHSDIAPGRKTDPGASFDWGRVL